MEISDIIKNEFEVLKKLEVLLDEEKEILIHDKSEEIPKILERKKDISREIAVIENFRIKLYGDKRAEDFADEGIIPHEIVNDIKNIVDSIRMKQETNMALTKQSISYIRTITNSLNPVEPNVTYGNSGRVGDISTTTIFTTKA